MAEVPPYLFAPSPKIVTTVQPPTAFQLPRLFLDVDGVLNAFRFDVNLATFDDFTDHAISVEDQNGFRRTFDVCLSRAMGERIASLSTEIVWATTWEHHADTYIAPLCGLPSGLDLLTDLSDRGVWHGTWKFDEVRRLVNEDPRPFVWVDDDIDTFLNGSESARRWAADLPIPNLLISPDPRSGLTHGHFDAIEEFLNEVR
jgi:hypothetical protein